MQFSKHLVYNYGIILLFCAFLFVLTCVFVHACQWVKMKSTFERIYGMKKVLYKYGIITIIIIKHVYMRLMLNSQRNNEKQPSQVHQSQLYVSV